MDEVSNHGLNSGQLTWTRGSIPNVPAEIWDQVFQYMPGGDTLACQQLGLSIYDISRQLNSSIGHQVQLVDPVARGRLLRKAIADKNGSAVVALYRYSPYVVFGETNTPIVSYLLEEGIHHPDQDNYKCVLEALFQAEPKAAKNGWVADLQKVAALGNLAGIDWICLLEGIDLDSDSLKGAYKTCLWKVSPGVLRFDESQWASFRALLKRVFDVNRSHVKSKKTALTMVCGLSTWSKQNIASKRMAVNLLLEAGAMPAQGDLVLIAKDYPKLAVALLDDFVRAGFDAQKEGGTLIQVVFNKHATELLPVLNDKGLKIDDRYLLEAAKSQDLKLLQVLVDLGLNANVRNADGKSPLRLVCEQSSYYEEHLEGKKKAIGLLLGAGARATQGDLVAVAKDSRSLAVEMLDDFVKAGLDLQQEGDALVQVAFKKQSAELLRALGDRGVKVDESYLHRACEKFSFWNQADQDRLIALIDLGLDPNAKGPSGKTAFSQLCATRTTSVIKESIPGKEKVLQFLLSHGARPAAGDLVVVAKDSRSLAVEMLDDFVKAGLDLQQEGDALVQVAFKKQSAELLRALDDRGVKVDESYLHKACEKFSFWNQADQDRLIALIDLGLDPNAKGPSGKTAFSQLCATNATSIKESIPGKEKVLRFLLSHGARPSKGDLVAVAKNCSSLAAVLLEDFVKAGLDIQEAGADLLELAFNKSSLELVKGLKDYDFALDESHLLRLCRKFNLDLDEGLQMLAYMVESGVSTTGTDATSGKTALEMLEGTSAWFADCEARKQQAMALLKKGI